MAGRGGTGAGAQFIQGIDQGLINLLTVRQERIVSDALSSAARPSVKYSKQPSAADLSVLAASRIGPAAQALGLRPELIAGARGQFTPEQQTENLQKAVELMREIEGFRLGPIQTQFRDLNDRFEEMAAEASRLGVSIEGFAAAQERAQNILTQESRQQLHAVMEAVGVMTSYQRASGDLNATMQIAINQAGEYGISLANVHVLHAQLQEQLRQEERLRLHGIMLAVGATSELGAAMGNLDAQMRIARIEAEKAGISTANWATTLQLAQNELIQEDRIRRHAVLEAVGLWDPLTRALQDLQVQMERAAVEANQMGYSVAQVTKTHRLAAMELIQQDRLRRHASLEAVGLWSPLERALYDLDVQMNLAAIEAKRLGYSTANLSKEHHRLAQAIIREHEAAIDAQALSITAPFEQMLDPLRQFARELTLGNLNPADQMKAAGDEFRRISELARAGSTTAIQQLQGAGEAFIVQMERFGASPGGAAARIEVQSVIEGVMADISQAQREASAGVEDTIRLASQRQVDTLRELITETRLVGEEIKRLGRR